MILRLAIAVALAGFLAPAAILDDFNRPDANTLGPNWTVVSGGAGITGNRAYGLWDLSLVTYNSVSASSAFVDVYNTGTGLQYAALVLGYSGVNSNYFIKVQNQGGGTQFSHYAFYYGNNGGGGIFASLNTPFSSGRIWATYLGTTAWLYIDSNFDGIADQQYSHVYGAAVSGSGIGLGFYGATQVDNFGTGEPVFGEIPEPATASLVLAGLCAAVVWKLRR